ncbi:MAG: hypothetical protein ABI837_06035 [Acidobacteriota bacterium]
MLTCDAAEEFHAGVSGVVSLAMARYRGSVQVKGRVHDVEVDGYYFLRTSIRVDGRVVASRGPMNLSFAFPFRIDGTPTTMRWIPVGLTYDCRVIADQNVALARVDRTGQSPVPSPVNQTGQSAGGSPVNPTGQKRPGLTAEQNELRVLRVAGLISLSLGMLMLFLGYGLEPGEYYSANGLAFGPSMTLIGIVCLGMPGLVRRLTTAKRVRTFLGVFFLLAVLASRIWFVPFFVDRFAKR